MDKFVVTIPEGEDADIFFFRFQNKYCNIDKSDLLEEYPSLTQQKTEVSIYFWRDKKVTFIGEKGRRIQYCCNEGRRKQVI